MKFAARYGDEGTGRGCILLKDQPAVFENKVPAFCASFPMDSDIPQQIAHLALLLTPGRPPGIRGILAKEEKGCQGREMLSYAMKC